MSDNWQNTTSLPPIDPGVQIHLDADVGADPLGLPTPLPQIPCPYGDCSTAIFQVESSNELGVHPETVELTHFHWELLSMIPLESQISIPAAVPSPF